MGFFSRLIGRDDAHVAGAGRGADAPDLRGSQGIDAGAGVAGAPATGPGLDLPAPASPSGPSFGADPAGQPGWQALAPLQRRIDPMTPIVAVESFSAGLRTWHHPGLLGGLDHGVSRDAPSGLVDGLATAVSAPADRPAGQVLTPAARPDPAVQRRVAEPLAGLSDHAPPSFDHAAPLFDHAAPSLAARPSGAPSGPATVSATATPPATPAPLDVPATAPSTLAPMLAARPLGGLQRLAVVGTPVTGPGGGPAVPLVDPDPSPAIGAGAAGHAQVAGRAAGTGVQRYLPLAPAPASPAPPASLGSSGGQGSSAAPGATAPPEPSAVPEPSATSSLPATPGSSASPGSSALSGSSVLQGSSASPGPSISFHPTSADPSPLSAGTLPLAVEAGRPLIGTPPAAGLGSASTVAGGPGDADVPQTALQRQAGGVDRPAGQAGASSTAAAQADHPPATSPGPAHRRLGLGAPLTASPRTSGSPERLPTAPSDAAGLLGDAVQRLSGPPEVGPADVAPLLPGRAPLAPALPTGVLSGRSGGGPVGAQDATSVQRSAGHPSTGHPSAGQPSAVPADVGTADSSIADSLNADSGNADSLPAGVGTADLPSGDPSGEFAPGAAPGGTAASTSATAEVRYDPASEGSAPLVGDRGLTTAPPLESAAVQRAGGQAAVPVRWGGGPDVSPPDRLARSSTSTGRRWPTAPDTVTAGGHAAAGGRAAAGTSTDLGTAPGSGSSLQRSGLSTPQLPALAAGSATSAGSAGSAPGGLSLSRTAVPTGIPSRSGMPSGAGMPSGPGMPSGSGLPSGPAMPSGATVPSLWRIPSVPGLPATGIPTAPAIPSMAGVPSAPGLPSMTDLPSVPDIPSVPDVPSVPGIGSLPGFGPVPGTGSLPEAGSLPAPASLPASVAAAAQPGPSGPSVAAGAAGAAASVLPSTDELVRRLFDPLAARLKAELRLDRERAGLITDLRR